MELRKSILQFKEKVPKCAGISKIHCVEPNHDDVCVKPTNVSSNSRRVLAKTAAVQSLFEALNAHLR